MPYTSSKFIYNFFILFLCILLSMFVMFMVMTHYDRDAEAEGGSSKVLGEGGKASDVRESGLSDLTQLYRANLFAIDLCLLVLAEATMILLFVKFTIPATLVATATVVFMTANSSRRLRGELIPEFLSLFVTNKYASLTHTDLVLLMVLSGLIMAFLVSVLLKQSGAKIAGEASQGRPPSPFSSSPSPPSSSPR